MGSSLHKVHDEANPPSKVDVTFSRGGIAARRDAPLLLPYKRGNLDDAVKAASSHEGRVVSLSTYNDRVYAKTSTRDSTWRTWSKVHLAWFGPEVHLLPLNPDIIRSIVGSMVYAGYRSVENYVSRAKDQHMAEGHEWSTILSREQTRAGAVAKRGRGPGHQAAELPLQEAFVFALKSDEDHYQGRCIYPRTWPHSIANFLTVGAMFVMREIELSLVLASSVSLDKVNRKVTISLPVSKTDPEALGCTRSWGCVCLSQRTGHGVRILCMLPSAHLQR